MRSTKLLVCGAALAAVTLTACTSADNSAPTGGGTNTEAKAGGQAGFDSLKSLSDAVAQKSNSAKSAHMTFTGGVGGETLEGQGDFSFAGEDTAMRMTMATPQGEITVLFVDNALYLKTGQELEPGKPWLKLDLGGTNPLGNSFDSVKDTDPRKMLAQLTESGEIKSVKADQIDGKATTHYSIVVDVAKLKDKDLGMDKAAIAELQKSGVKTIPIEVWVDGDSLPVRFITEVPAAGQNAKIQADYSDWGKAVEIKAPPAAEVAEFPGG
ncbi:hypothetical protein [Actinokineospora sp.]|uniref:hypothetical protein n=1 Tax=Actinokineospora sp. TaxID=1872133 RepID=UPI0040378E21